MATPSFEEVYRDYEGLCRYEAHRHWHAFGQIHDLDDLIQEGYIGLWNAYENCANWTTFPKFAHLRISGNILKYCKANNHIIRVPTADKRSGNEYKPYDIASLSYQPNSSTGDVWSDNAVTLEYIIPAPEEDVELTIDVKTTLAHMPEQQARNLWAVCAEGWKQMEYARHVGQHENTVQQSVTRAKVRFAKLWEGVPLSKNDKNACRVHIAT